MVGRIIVYGALIYFVATFIRHHPKTKRYVANAKLVGTAAKSLPAKARRSVKRVKAAAAGATVGIGGLVPARRALGRLRGLFRRAFQGPRPVETPVETSASSLNGLNGPLRPVEKASDQRKRKRVSSVSTESETPTLRAQARKEPVPPHLRLAVLRAQHEKRKRQAEAQRRLDAANIEADLYNAGNPIPVLALPGVAITGGTMITTDLETISEHATELTAAETTLAEHGEAIEALLVWSRGYGDRTGEALVKTAGMESAAEAVSEAASAFQPAMFDALNDALADMRQAVNAAQVVGDAAEEVSAQGDVKAYTAQ
ncbi:MAG: hypothetical protein ACRCYU_05220 [Nocardioides sp.]